ncbi:MAG TPA: hypothetical protein PK054_12610 [Anaerohalosphaeraceae bacterium]|nr:hypothetical protein [Anaerohalosphaeraceae bacterium]HOL90002.1 hypothetical protein [Anaerohalosphaeraceae bacterium]HPP57407.1 hypothetical protein [Anaerohalosphaeraceae bacterium]
MPTYCYRLPDGTIEERFYPMGKAPQTIRTEDGQIGKRDYSAEHGRFKNTRTATWPMVSVAVGVHPSQREEAMREAAAMGVPTEFNENGDAIFRSAKHRKAFCRAFGFYDKNGGYSDP